MPRLKPFLCATACAGTILLPGGCGGVSPGSFCALYQPVYTAPSDTEETRRQTDENNAVWWVLCRNKISFDDLN